MVALTLSELTPQPSTPDTPESKDQGEGHPPYHFLASCFSDKGKPEHRSLSPQVLTIGGSINLRATGHRLLRQRGHMMRGRGEKGGGLGRG